MTTTGSSPRLLAAFEIILIITLSCLYFASFELESPVNGKHEIFDQDSSHIIEAATEGRRYPWNAQHHILYHQLVSATGLGSGRHVPAESAYLRLKLISGAAGLAFLFALRLLLQRMGLDAPRRTIVIALAGVSIGAWASFSIIETYALALPFLVLVLAALWRMIATRKASFADSMLLVAGLIGAMLARIELAGLAFWIIGAALLLPGLAGLRRTLVICAVVAGVVAGTATIALVGNYLGVRWKVAVLRILERQERATLASTLMRAQNLVPGYLLRVARAGTVYGFVMPIAGSPSTLDIPGSSQARPFRASLRNMRSQPVPAIALVAALGMLIVAFTRILRQVVRGDPFFLMLTALWIGLWVGYTWFNSHEPYLWIGPFFVLTLVVFADVVRGAERFALAMVSVVVLLIALHNAQTFWIPVR